MQEELNLNESQAIIPNDKALEYMLGGNALFTVRSINTAQRYTFKILKSQRQENVFSVKLLNGPDNTRNYKDIGVILGSINPMFVPSERFQKEKYCIALEHIVTNLTIRSEMPNLQIWHNGRCCKCGRVLTVPESIAMGIGPECIFTVNRRY